VTGLRSGQVAAAAGINQQTLRYYRRRGLLAEPDRSLGGHRLYPAETVTVVRVIKAAQRAKCRAPRIRALALTASARRAGGAPGSGGAAGLARSTIGSRLARPRLVIGSPGMPHANRGLYQAVHTCGLEPPSTPSSPSPPPGEPRYRDRAFVCAAPPQQRLPLEGDERPGDESAACVKN
jgi:hypothetical protein